MRRLRVLCTCTGGGGHVNAMTPVARALRDGGHDVQWAVAPDGGDVIGAMGFEWSPAGLSTPERREAAGTAIDDAMRLPMSDRRGPLFGALFARAAGRVMQRDLAPIMDRFRPDVILREMAELAGGPMAAVRGIPVVTVAFSGVLPERARVEVLEDLGPLWRAEGLDDPSWADVLGQLYLHPFPASFGQRPDSPVVRAIRPDRGSPSDAPAAWVRALGVDRPLVYLTSGTERPALMFPWAEAFAALDSFDVDVVATIGGHVDQATLGTVPARVRVERFVPQGDLLTRASAVISHGGAGTVLGAAAAGRPQLVVPLFADQWENGVAVRNAGCGVVLGPDRRSADDIARGLRTLLDGSSHRDAATSVADEIAAMPTAADLTAEIAALADD